MAEHKVEERKQDQHRNEERARQDERARREEVKPGERAPGGEDNPKVGYAAGKIIELLLGLHPEDRQLAVEHVNKTGLLSGGESKIEKDQKEAAKKRQEDSDKWVKESKFFNQKVSEEAAKAAQEKHDLEVDKSKGKAK